MTSLTSDSEAERWGDSVAQVNQQMLHNGSSDARRRSLSISFGETPLLPSLYTTFAMASNQQRPHQSLGYQTPAEVYFGETGGVHAD